ncbi:biotin/lipoate A/B protein ligase family protein [Sulfolobus tengchongensis]|uniref:Biotin/lipoate A/B protein ligase family protein n=1 Tax=Sulfolobus tengchongensis TaxID=207809 RepID=A0AAX4KZJ4_9CREN
MKLRVLLSEWPDNPYLNVALDEALLLKQKDGAILRIWRNDKTVVLGILSAIKNEVNLDFIEKEKIKLVRRISGGGTVFHDLGNINYTIIVVRPDDELTGIDYLYDKLLRGTINSIESLINDKIEVYNKTDLTFKGYKISGNAGYIHEERYMLHGTLLISSNLELMYKALIIPPKNYKKNNVNMIKYRVNNLSNLINKKITYQNVIEALTQNFLDLLGYESYYFDVPTNEELELAVKLTNEKYSRREFIYRRL